MYAKCYTVGDKQKLGQFFSSNTEKCFGSFTLILILFLDSIRILTLHIYDVCSQRNETLNIACRTFIKQEAVPAGLDSVPFNV